MFPIDLLATLCEWYKEQCNGEWEHKSGIHIETLDNPGWYIKINLRDTTSENDAFETVKIDDGNGNWISCFKKETEFIGAGDPSKLPVILENFLKFVGKM